MNYEITKDYVWKEVGSQVVILHVDSGMYWSLNSTSSLIWKGIINRIPIDGVVESICEEFDADKDTITQDVEEMVDNFLDKKMIQLT